MSNEEIKKLILEYADKYNYETAENVRLKDYGLNFKYDNDSIITLLNQIHTTEDQESLYTETIKKYKKKMVIKKWGKYIRDIFKMHNVLGISPMEIAKIYHMKCKTIQNWMTDLNWNRTPKEAMQYAKLRRNYTEIHRKGKQTAALKYKSGGSDSEEYIRSIINLFLCNYIDLPYIVGCNNISLASKEIDIPILIINGNDIDKFAIEINGVTFHKDIEKDIQKQLILESEGFKVISEYIESFNYEEEGKQIAINIMTQIQDYYSNI